MHLERGKLRADWTVCQFPVWLNDGTDAVSDRTLDQFIPGSTLRYVKGRPTPATDGRLKTGHFEETTLRRVDSSVYPTEGVLRWRIGSRWQWWTRYNGCWIRVGHTGGLAANWASTGTRSLAWLGSQNRITQTDGTRRRTHVLRVVLSHSRKAYSEVVERQRTDNFIRCLENAFWYFCGTPQRVVLDNLRAAVQQADWFDPELNPKVQAFAAHYGVVMMPTKPYTPRHKGKVERGVDYVQENGLKGHTFSSLAAENQHLLAWEQGVADTRLHGTTRQQVGKLFCEVEQACLQPLPLARFPFFHEGQRSVHRDEHVEVAKAYYPVPPEYVGRRVWARWDGQVVRVFNSASNRSPCMCSKCQAASAHTTSTWRRPRSAVSSGAPPGC